MAGFTLLSFNTWKCDGDYAARLPLMVEGIKQLAPDVILLQEAFCASGENFDTAGAIAARGGYQLARARARRKIRHVGGKDVDSSSDLAILTRSPARSVRVVDLEADPRDGERVALLADVDTPLGVLSVGNVHLSHLADGDALRRRQFMAAIGALPPGAGAVVGGDFNCPGDRIPVPGTAFASHRITHSTTVGPHRLKDGTLNPIPPAAGRRDRRAIDHVFVLRPRGVSSGVSLAGAKVVLNAPDPSTGLYASDHAGVLAQISD